MKKFLIFASVIMIFLVLFSGCRKKESAEREAAPEVSGSSAVSTEVADSTMPPPTEYSSADEIKNDVLRFQEALSARDVNKCEAIVGSELQARCSQTLKNPVEK